MSDLIGLPGVNSSPYSTRLKGATLNTDIMRFAKPSQIEAKYHMKANGFTTS